MKFLIDAQLPPALARWINQKGHTGIHVFELGFESTDDDVIWEQARIDRAVVVSKDEDFVDRWLLNDPPVPLVWIRKGNCSNQVLLMWLESQWPEIVSRLEQGEQFIELRG